MSNQTVVVNYQTQKHYCACCNQKLPEAETSKPREFEISKEDALHWANWKDAAEYPEDLESMVDEFVYEIIKFHAVDSNVKLIIEESEVEKVREFILREVVA